MGRHREQRRRKSAPSVALLAMTGADGVEHLVTDDEMAAGRDRGCYVAACGAEVLAASLTVRESSRCEDCRHKTAR